MAAGISRRLGRAGAGKGFIGVSCVLCPAGIEYSQYIALEFGIVVVAQYWVKIQVHVRIIE